MLHFHNMHITLIELVQWLKYKCINRLANQCWNWSCCILSAESTFSFSNAVPNGLMIIYAYDGSVQNLVTASIANEYLLVHSIYDYLIWKLFSHNFLHIYLWVEWCPCKYSEYLFGHQVDKYVIQSITDGCLVEMQVIKVLRTHSRVRRLVLVPHPASFNTHTYTFVKVWLTLLGVL
jgi:hypothetical protein